MPAQEMSAGLFPLGADTTTLLIVVSLIYIALGCVMESMSMLLLTIPVFVPVMTSLGVDPVWFGILLVCVVEVGLITPPVGMNVFVIRAMVPSVGVGGIWRALAPFIVADVVRLAILIGAPSFVLFLPRVLGLMQH